MSLLIKNGTVVTAEREFHADILTDGQVIVRIAPEITASADRVIDASGRYVIPGGIDVHTHLDMPYGDIASSDDFETGTRAAAFGGTTTIIDFATQSKGERLIDVLAAWHEKARGKAVIDYGFHMIITDCTGGQIDEIPDLIRHGVSSLKLFMAYPGKLMVDDETIRRIMAKARACGALICIHAEDGPAIEQLILHAIAARHMEPRWHAATRPPATEASAIRRIISLAGEADVPVYIVHCSSGDGLREISGSRRDGLRIHGETCPQYLFCSIDDLSRPGFEGAKYVLTPPLREREHQEALWTGLVSGDLSIVATDHCPFNFAGQKELGRSDFRKIPNGGPGIENRLQILYELGVNRKRFDRRRWVGMISTAPARLFGCYPAKGTIEEGSDADIVIWDPAARYVISAATHHMRVDYSLYEGFSGTGNAETVISRGEVIIDSYHWLGRTGRGKFIPRTPFTDAWKPLGHGT